VVYPDSFEEDSFAYQQVLGLLHKIGIPAPKTYFLDGSLGIVLQEDLGDRLLLDELGELDESEQKPLLLQAIDYILKFQVEGSAALEPESLPYRLAFDKEKLLWELRFFHEHYLGNFSQYELRDEVELQEEYDQLASGLARYPQVFCHRDYQVRNILAKDGVLYVVDFQDARWGPPAYDLVSLLKDSIDLNELTIQELCHYYRKKIQLKKPAGVPQSVFEEEEFELQFQLMSVQRLLKALGTYGFQVSQRKKWIYLQYMVGTLQRALLSLRKLSVFPAMEEMVQQQLSRTSGSLLGHQNEE
jgi:aminoglycoside/choline kinase family phosphotransferase